MPPHSTPSTLCQSASPPLAIVASTRRWTQLAMRRTIAYAFEGQVR